MASSQKLPLELEEEILVRLPPLSLARFRIVCRRWTTLFNAKRFINHHLALAHVRPQFIVRTNSKIYSISYTLDDDPNIDVREITLEIPGLESHSHVDPKFNYCDGIVLSTNRNEENTVWNPWLRQSRRIESEVTASSRLCGIGYNGGPDEKSYKIVGYTNIRFNKECVRLCIYEFATKVCKYIDAYSVTKQMMYDNVSLNGNLYWIDCNHHTDTYFIQSLDCSREIVRPFCVLPCKKKDYFHRHALAVFKGDRLSLLIQYERTRNIEIWITKNKINNGDDGEAVLWITFMSVSSIPNFPLLYNLHIGSSLSYSLDDNIYGKSLVVCCRDDTGQPCIFVVRGDLRKKIKLDFVVDYFYHSVYVPSLIRIP